MNDLLSLEQKYINNNDRRQEVSKIISLKSLSENSTKNSGVFDELLTNGSCYIELTEDLFDLDFPGQYLRQIKTISISLPALLGPYQNIHATLTQNYNRVVLKADSDAVEALLYPDEYNLNTVENIRSNYASNQQISITQGINDHGLFQLSFDDPRYLPFEGTGAVSGWTLSIPKEQNLTLLKLVDGVSKTEGESVNITSDTELNLSDVIIEVMYTSQDGGSTFKDNVWRMVKPDGYVWEDNQVEAEWDSSNPVPGTGNSSAAALTSSSAQSSAALPGSTARPIPILLGKKEKARQAARTARTKTKRGSKRKSLKRSNVKSR